MASAAPTTLVLGTQVYPLVQHYAAKGTTLDEHLDEAFGWVAAAGLTCVEIVGDAEDRIQRQFDAAGRAGLSIVSTYQGAKLHDSETWRASADKVVELAVHARKIAGSKLLVLNPDPISWSAPQDKDDAQLRTQAGALRYLHDTLASKGIALAYHTHDAEMRQGAREFHHMMLATADKPMKWCLDTHWLYRGCGNSNVALEDAVKLYGNRVATMHLRQSVAGVWTETFSAGDVDPRPWVSLLRGVKFAGPIYLEQSVEAGTPMALSPGERLAESAKFLKSRI